MNDDQIRIFSDLLSATLALHSRELNLMGDSRLGHTSIAETSDEEAAQDVECLTCGHINEAEYALAQANADLHSRIYDGWTVARYPLTT